MLSWESNIAGWFFWGFQQEHASEFMAKLRWPAKNYLPTVAIGSERSERVSHYTSSGFTNISMPSQHSVAETTISW
jgi:thiamine monophosphate synthase